MPSYFTKRLLYQTPCRSSVVLSAELKVKTRVFTQHSALSTQHSALPLSPRKHALRRRDAGAKFNRMSHLVQDQLDAGDRRQDVELVDVAHVGQPDDLPL